MLSDQLTSNAAHVIQIALTPVFLLAGTAGSASMSSRPGLLGSQTGSTAFSSG